MILKYVAGILALGTLSWAGAAVSKSHSSGSYCPTGSCCVLDAPCCKLPQSVSTTPDCCYPGSPCCEGKSTQAGSAKTTPDCCYPGSPCCYPGSPCCESGSQNAAECSCCSKVAGGCCGEKK